jgi:hypothetical protein
MENARTFLATLRPRALKFGVWTKCEAMLCGVFCACSLLAAQTPQKNQFDESGQIAVEGRSTPYRIRRLPVSSFPDLPAELRNLLNQRGCLIPQTYEAHAPENVVHASLEGLGSSDWAVLCSVQGTVSLLIYFSSAPDQLYALASVPETQRLQAHDASGILGFNWGIDPASPERIHDAQTGLAPRPARTDHDALADTILDHRAVYHYFLRNAWTLLHVSE